MPTKTSSATTATATTALVTTVDFDDDDSTTSDSLSLGATVDHYDDGIPDYPRPENWTIDIRELTRFTVDSQTGQLNLEKAPESTPADIRNHISDAIGPTKFLGMAVNPNTGKLCEYLQLAASSLGARWQLAFCIEWGRLFQGFQADDPKYSVKEGTNTCQLVQPSEIPEGKKATYIRICSNYREQKGDPYRVQCTVGGNLIDFPGHKSTRTADLVTAKYLINNIISTPGARAACIAIRISTSTMIYQAPNSSASAEKTSQKLSGSNTTSPTMSPKTATSMPE
jgi:hypothetical protein